MANHVAFEPGRWPLNGLRLSEAAGGPRDYSKELIAKRKARYCHEVRNGRFRKDFLIVL
jgi:hypothetical protein